MSQRLLIINADDFGACPATNEAIEQICNEGLLSSTTVMTPCPNAEDAIARAKANPRIRMGLHIVTTAEKARKWPPVAGLDKAPSLADEKGHMYADAAAFARHARHDEVAAEIEAQYQYVTARGMTPTHADSHVGSVYGLHGPSFMKETLEFCARHRLAFRFPKNIDGVKGIVHMDALPGPLVDMHAQAVAYAEALGVKLIDYLFTNTADFAVLTDYDKLKGIYFDMISRLPEGVSEIFMHPSLPSSPLAVNYPTWQARVWEHQLLLDDALRKHLDKENVRLITYQDIP